MKCVAFVINGINDEMMRHLQCKAVTVLQGHVFSSSDNLTFCYVCGFEENY